MCKLFYTVFVKNQHHFISCKKWTSIIWYSSVEFDQPNRIKLKNDSIFDILSMAFTVVVHLIRVFNENTNRRKLFVEITHSFSINCLMKKKKRIEKVQSDFWRCVILNR